MIRRSQTQRRQQPDRGLSLVEVVVSISLLGVAVVSLLLALSTAVTTSAQQRRQATADALLRGGAEVLSTAATTYVNCATTTTYSSFPYADPSGRVTIKISKVEYWNGSGPTNPGFATSCGTDRGVQRITLQATSGDGKTTESLVVMKRKTT